MADDDLARKLLALERRILSLEGHRVAARAVTSRLLHFMAKRSDDPDAVLKDFSETGDSIVDSRSPQTPGGLQGAELIRAEVDWIVQAAGRFLRLASDPPKS